MVLLPSLIKMISYFPICSRFAANTIEDENRVSHYYETPDLGILLNLNIYCNLKRQKFPIHHLDSTYSLSDLVIVKSCVVG